MHNDIVKFLNESVSGCEATLRDDLAGDPVIFVNKENIYDVCKNLKEGKFEFNVLQVITGTDYEDRYEVSYILASYSKNSELILKTKLNKDKDENKETEPVLDTVTSLWKAANFQERECYDMLGVTFTNHPDPRRILCPDDWKGFPLRKDYVVEEVYNGMTVNPAEKINSADHNYFQEMKEKYGDKKVMHSWKK